MGLSKTILFTRKQNRLAELFKALAHPARLAILQAILQSKQCICGDLVTETGLAQATVSQHLKELKKAGLIKGTVEGVRICYCIDTVNWEKMKAEAGALFAMIVQSDEECC